NEFDLDGNWGFGSIVKAVTRVASKASWLPGPAGMIASGVEAVGFAAQGNWAQAAIAAVGVIPGGKQATAIVKATGQAVRLARDANKARKLVHELTYAAAAAEHAGSRPYMHSVLLVKEIMSTKPIRDPGGAPGAVAWKVAGRFNKTVGH